MAKSDENTEKQGGKKGKGDEKKTTMKFDASELWLSGRKTVEDSNESDEDEQNVPLSIPNIMETGSMMGISSIMEKSRNVTQDSDKGSDDIESNHEKKTDRKKKKKKKNKHLEHTDNESEEFDDKKEERRKKKKYKKDKKIGKSR